MPTFVQELDRITEAAQSGKCISWSALKTGPTGRPGSTLDREKKQACVALVDDDELALSALRMLLEISGGFCVLEFTDPLRAIEAMKDTPVDIVISDFMMPGIRGLDLLKRARALQPEAMRILLTGYADKENAIRALNEAGIYQYMEKPWDNEHLLRVLRSALREKDLRQQQTERIRALDRLLTEYTDLAEAVMSTACSRREEVH